MYPSYTFIYHSIPSYDGICEYMSGYQGVRIPDAILVRLFACHGPGAAHDVSRVIPKNTTNSIVI